MRRNLNIDTYYLAPDVNIIKEILNLGDEQKRSTNVQADSTSFHTHRYSNTFKYLTNYLNVLYPQHIIEELWGCTYRQGDFAKTHNHSGFDLAFVWFVDTCSFCSPLVFPDTEHLWLPPLASIKPLTGNLHVFRGRDIHYVPPHTCPHDRMVISGNMALINTMAEQQQQQ